MSKNRPENRAVFLDRDGTLNVDYGYVHDREHWTWLPGVLPTLRDLQEAGWLLVVISNQSGVGRGYFSLEDVKKLEEWVDREMEGSGAHISRWADCPHAPEDNCGCRKPKPGLILQTARELTINLKHSWMIGDRLRDAQAGLAAGCQAGLLYNKHYPQEWQKCRACFPQVKMWHDLASAAFFILSQTEAG